MIKKMVFILPFLLLPMLLGAQEKGAFTDPRDGKVYKTVTIGEQTWLAENLAYFTQTGCWAYNNENQYVRLYGYLYNWDAAKTACLPGWHLPSKNEWETLIRFLGGDDEAIYKMKSALCWELDEDSKIYEESTDEIGFSVLPAGYRDSMGHFMEMGEKAIFWTGSPENPANAWRLILHQYNDFVFFFEDSILEGCSVRCIKD